jgi:hypothetical protein
MTLYEAQGRLRYSLKKPDSDQNWWLVLDCETESIGSYYRHLYWMSRNKGHKLCRPYWGSHITVVRNEQPPNENKWWAYEGEIITFQYMPGVRDNYGPERYRSFYWVDVICPRFDEIRVELGLPRNPDGIFHMTIGSTDNEANRHIYERLWGTTPNKE